MARRNVETLMRRVREELRAEGPDGAGYSDFLIIDAMGSAVEDLGEVFPIRDFVEITSVAETNTYEVDVDDFIDIIRVEYDGNPLKSISIDAYIGKVIKDEGSVNEWLLWGNQVILVGEVEADKTIKMWVTRTPKKLKEKGDVPETPDFADEAIIAYAISVCYREMKDYGRADYHYGIYINQKNSILRRAVPQKQRDLRPRMRGSYWGPVRGTSASVRSDTNPGGYPR